MQPALWPVRVQGVYYVLSGAWPLLSITTFQMVTGPKTDLWLVRMVGLLVLSVGTTLFLASLSRRLTPEVIFLALASAVAFTLVDSVYSLIGRIRKIYLADAAVETLLIIAIALALRSSRLHAVRRIGGPGSA